MKCKKCGSTFYVDFDPFQGIIESDCPLCGYPHAGTNYREKKISEYLLREFEKLKKEKEKQDA